MSLTYDQACMAMDKIFSDGLKVSENFRAELNASTKKISLSEDFTEYSLVERLHREPNENIIASPVYQHLIGTQATFGGEALYDREGLIFIYLLSKDMKKNLDIAQKISDFYQGERAVYSKDATADEEAVFGEVWFRDVRISEFFSLGAFETNPRNQIYKKSGDFQVIAEFSYQQLK